MSDDKAEQQDLPESRTRRILQSVGAIIVTALAFYFLLGVPAYLLYGMYFAESS